MSKSLLMLGVFIGSLVGGYIPTLFGADAFSISSVIFGGLGSIIGLWLAYRIQQ